LCEQLPEPIDIEALAVKNRMTESDVVRLLRAAEIRGSKVFSRIDSVTRTLRYYWR
jgi:hypothetical protein